MRFVCIKCNGEVEGAELSTASWVHLQAQGCTGTLSPTIGAKRFDCQNCHASWYVSVETIGKIADSHWKVGKCPGPIVEYQPATESAEPTEPKPASTIDHPGHYTQGKVECIEALEAALSPAEFKGFLKGDVLKYLWRSELKNGKQDLEKAKWYLEKLLSLGVMMGMLLLSGCQRDNQATSLPKPSPSPSVSPSPRPSVRIHLNRAPEIDPEQETERN